MSRPKNKDEYRQEMAEAFAHVLEEKGLEWRKEWTGTGVRVCQIFLLKFRKHLRFQYGYLTLVLHFFSLYLLFWIVGYWLTIRL